LLIAQQVLKHDVEDFDKLSSYWSIFDLLKKAP
jgi:hypothetical protein